jgi:hypothetical protein
MKAPGQEEERQDDDGCKTGSSSETRNCHQRGRGQGRTATETSHVPYRKAAASLYRWETLGGSSGRRDGKQQPSCPKTL